MYRNFIVCPHCERRSLSREITGLINPVTPNISRSDGESYHLALADRLYEYPAERGERSCGYSACFTYLHEMDADTSRTVIVLLPQVRPDVLAAFRRLDLVADLLAEQLERHPRLALVYELWEEP